MFTEAVQVPKCISSSIDRIRFATDISGALQAYQGYFQPIKGTAGLLGPQPMHRDHHRTATGTTDLSKVTSVDLSGPPSMYQEHHRPIGGTNHLPIWGTTKHQ